MLAIDKLRFAISEFNGMSFTTTQLRSIYNITSMIDVLEKMVKDGEIEFLGMVRTRGIKIDVWREAKLRYSETAEKPTSKNDCLPGWRASFPELFTDPKLCGVSRLHTNDL